MMSAIPESDPRSVSTMVCPYDGELMPATPPGGMTTCPHCGSVYRLDELYELSVLEGPKKQSA